MKNLSSDARSLVESARGGDAPSHADSARVKRALVAAIAAGAAGTSASAAAAATRSAAPGSAAGAGITAGKIAGWVGIGATVGLATAGTWAAFSGPSKDEARPVVVAPSRSTATAETVAAKPLPAIDVPAESAPAEPVVPVEVPVAPPAARRAAARAEPRSPARAASQASSLGAETALIRSARAALGAGDAHGALALLREHARDYPNGVLVEERLASQVFASCALGQRANAARAAAELIRRAPSSPLRARVLDSCARPE